ncbi:serine hydrolase domain-containing protein [Kitasatospora sp. NPDC056446]|uniref:serine hydrolase domain-containing protein n=1 Tax=Kitasatospora sp. NPDC056446 TaxID=3345819 RepID=UPI0036C42388
MKAIRNARDRVLAAIGEGTHLGIQLYVSRRGEVLLDEAYGEVEPGVALTVEDRLPWICCTKLLGALAVGQQLRAGAVTADTPLAELVPEFAVRGKERATLAQLMSHALPFRPESVALPYSGLGHQEAFEAACAIELTGEPGTGGWYSAMESWVVLAEIVRRLTGQDYAEYVAERVLRPLGMTRTVFAEAGTPEARPPREVGLFERVDGRQVPSGRVSAKVLAPHLPGTGAWGPAAELARLVECLAAPERHPELGLDRATVDLLAADHRSGLPDRNFGDLDLAWGLGMCTDRAWYSAPAGARVAGHTAYGCGMVVADLDRDLAVSFLSSSVVPPGGSGSRLENLIVRDLCRAVRESA